MLALLGLLLFILLFVLLVLKFIPKAIALAKGEIKRIKDKEYTISAKDKFFIYLQYLMSG